MDIPDSFKDFNPIKFIYDLFFHFIDLVEAIYNFLTFEINIPKGFDVGIWDYDFPFMEDLPDTLSVLQLLGGTGASIILILVFLKIILPFIG